MSNQSRDIELEKKIDAYIKGNLSGEEVEQLWVELIKKPEYISLLETEIDVARIYQAKKQEKTPGKNLWRWIAVAATVVLLVISINFFSTDAQMPLREWTQHSINLSENLSSAPVTRSATDISTSDSLLNAGFKAAIEGNTEKAISIFEGMLTEYEDPPLRAKIHLNLGILKYNTGDYASSIQNFKQTLSAAADGSPMAERAYWYMGNALINNEQLKQAHEAVKKVYTSGEIYKTEAFKLLKRLDYELGNIDFENFEKQVNESK